eukprot:8026185-Alexandrium_andersonii.AAC.1
MERLQVHVPPAQPAVQEPALAGCVPLPPRHWQDPVQSDPNHPLGHQRRSFFGCFSEGCALVEAVARSLPCRGDQVGASSP